MGKIQADAEDCASYELALGFVLINKLKAKSY